MAKFYLIGKISEELMKRMQNDPSADRYASTKKVTEAAGLKLISYEWVRGRFDVISCVEGEYDQALALKIAFKNSGLMDDLMVHEVIISTPPYPPVIPFPSKKAINYLSPLIIDPRPK